MGIHLRTSLTNVADGRRFVKSHAEHLRSGLWITTNRKVHRHWRCGSPPPHLRSVIDMKRGAAGSLTARSLALGRTAASAVWVRGGGAYSLLLPASGDALLLDPDRQQCLRLLESPLRDVVLETRVALSRHLRTPRFELSPDKMQLTEALIVGAPLVDASAKVRAHAVAALLRGYTAHASANRAGTAGPLIREAIALLEIDGVPAGLRRAVEEHNVARIAETWPLVPSHGNLHPGNIIITDGGPTLIDFQSARSQPFFFDPVHLISFEARQGRPDLIAAYFGGAFESEVVELAKTAECALETRAFALGAILCDLLFRSEGPETDVEFIGQLSARAWRAVGGFI